MAVKNHNQGSIDVSDKPRWTLGVDGDGREHKITVGCTHAIIDDERVIELPDDYDVVKWGIHVLNKTDQYWETFSGGSDEDVRRLTGDVEVLDQ